MNEIQVESNGATLACSYSAAGSTAIVALHGAGEGTRDWYLYRHLHDVLPPAGIGVVTFDRRGEGESTGEVSRGLFAVQADDALAVAASVDAERVGLWGISQGGWVAPLAATRSDRVAFLVLLASTGVTPAEQMRYAVAEQIRRAGFGDGVAERAVALRERAEAWIRGGSSDELDAELAAAAREPWWELTFLPDQLPPAPEADAVRQELAEEMFFEPEPVFAGVRVPTSSSTATTTAGRPSGRASRRGGAPEGMRPTSSSCPTRDTSRSTAPARSRTTTSRNSWRSGAQLTRLVEAVSV